MSTNTQSNTMTNEQLVALVQKMAADQAALTERLAKAEAKAQAKAELRFKIGEKKAVSVYGLNVKFPVTLYGAQWLRLLAKAEDLRKFIETHRNELAWKDVDTQG